MMPLGLGYLAGELDAHLDAEWVEAHEDCLRDARNNPNWRTSAPEWEGIFGIVYGDGTVHCVPFFTNKIIGPAGEILPS